MLGNSYYVGARALLGINGRRFLGTSRYFPPGFDFSAVRLSVSLQDIPATKKEFIWLADLSQFDFYDQTETVNASIFAIKKHLNTSFGRSN